MIGRKSSKLLSFLIVFAMMFTMVMPAAVFAEEETEPSILELTVTGPTGNVPAEATNFEVTFKVEHNNKLEYLEIDHNLGKHGSLPEEVDVLPEFKLYPNADNPWASSEMDDTKANTRKKTAEDGGLGATYKVENGTHTWTLTFGGDALGQIRALTAEYTDNQFKIYSLVKDVEGNQSGSMYDGTYEITIVTLEEVKEQTKSEYGFEITNADQEFVAGDLLEGTVIEGKDGVETTGLTPVEVTLKATTINELGYDNVKVLAPEVTGGEGTLQFWAYSADDEKWFNAAVTGWGSGFKLSHDYNVTTPIYVFTDTAGTYEVTFKLVDLDNNEEVIAEKTATITVVEALPEQSTYKLTYTGLAESYTVGELVTGDTQEEINAAVEAVIDGLKPVQVTLATDVLGKTGYKAVRILPVGAGSNIQLWAKDTSNNWYDINVTGWGDPSSGFKLPADYNVTTEVYILSNKAEEYELEMKLVDLSDNSVIAEASGKVKVIEASEDPEAAVEPTAGVSPEDGATVEGEQEFTFGFKSVTGKLQELELDIYLGENTGADRNYADHLGINLPAGSNAVATWVDQVVTGYEQLDSKFHGLLAAAGYVKDNENKADILKQNIFYTAGEDGTGTWTIKLHTAVLGEEAIEFLVAVRDDQGAQWGENNFNKPDADTKAFLYNVTLPEEPEEFHTYKFNIEDKAEEYIVSEGLVEPTDDDFEGMTPVKLSIVVNEEKDKAYDGMVRVAPVNADGLQLWAKDTEGKWHDINQVGWGPKEGFQIDTTLVTDVYVIATAAFGGNITLKLVDVTGDYGAEDKIIISQEVAFKAVETEITGKVKDIRSNNILIVGEYLFNLNDKDSGYNLNNFLIAAQSAHYTEDEEGNRVYEIYYRAGDKWYNLVRVDEIGEGLVDAAIVDAEKVNGHGTYTYWNMEEVK